MSKSHERILFSQKNKRKINERKLHYIGRVLFFFLFFFGWLSAGWVSDCHGKMNIWKQVLAKSIVRIYTASWNRSSARMCVLHKNCALFSKWSVAAIFTVYRSECNVFIYFLLSFGANKQQFFFPQTFSIFNSLVIIIIMNIDT